MMLYERISAYVCNKAAYFIRGGGGGGGLSGYYTADRGNLNFGFEKRLVQFAHLLSQRPAKNNRQTIKFKVVSSRAT